MIETTTTVETKSVETEEFGVVEMRTTTEVSEMSFGPMTVVVVEMRSTFPDQPGRPAGEWVEMVRRLD